MTEPTSGMHFDWAVVIATLVGPILAVWASEWRQQRRQLREQQERVFYTLMATRATRLHPDHVASLNRIEIAFPPLKHPKVADAWMQYLRQLEDREAQARDSQRWAERAHELFCAILAAMAEDLKIPFSMASIKYAAYVPLAQTTAELQFNEIRELFLQLLRSQNRLGPSSSAEKSPPTQ